MERSIILMLKNIFKNSIVTYIVPSADASCEYSKGKIVGIHNRFTIKVIDMDDNHQYDLGIVDIIKFNEYNIIKKGLLKLLK